uniref:C-type lectin lectoxin-Thr1 n=1 Tax=Talaromyces marneffei PM1 TaxID=1077442 RepID=A0A093VB55_TALMA
MSSRLGLQCVRGIKLLFREDAIERGIHFGREGTWSKRCKRIKKPPVLELDNDFTGVPLDQYHGRWIWLNTTYNDFTGEPNKWDDGENEVELFSPIGNDAGCWGDWTKLSLSSSQNPYMSLVPLLSYTTFRNTILAVSANQLSLLGDTRYSKEARMYKQKALTGLTQIGGTSTEDFGVVASVLMLCFHDISDNCSPSWVTHLRGGLDMTQYLPAGSAQMESLKRFFNMYFVAHDIMSRTAPLDCDDEPVHEWLENDDLDEIDTTVGCSRRLMTLVSQTSSLARQRRKVKDMNSDFIRRCEDVGMGLESLHQKLPALTSTTESFILQIAEIKRLSALLYFTENLGDLVSPSLLSSATHSSRASYHTCSMPTRLVYSPSSSPFSSTSSPASPASTTSSTTSTSSSSSSSSSSSKNSTAIKQRLVSTIIDLISTLPNPNTASVMWPLYIIGHSTGLEDEAQRRFVLERLRAIQSTRNLGNVRQVRLAVEKNFRMTDLDLSSSTTAPISSLSKRRDSVVPGMMISLA